MSKQATILETAALPSNSYQDLADKVRQLANAMQKWIDGRSTLLMVRENRALTEEERVQLCAFNSSLDSYYLYLEDLGELPAGSWIDQANAASVPEFLLDPPTQKGPEWTLCS